MEIPSRDLNNASVVRSFCACVDEEINDFRVVDFLSMGERRSPKVVADID